MADVTVMGMRMLLESLSSEPSIITDIRRLFLLDSYGRGDGHSLGAYIYRHYIPGGREDSIYAFVKAE